VDFFIVFKAHVYNKNNKNTKKFDHNQNELKRQKITVVVINHAEEKKYYTNETTNFD